MNPFHFSLSATLSDLQASMEQVEQMRANLAELHRILTRIRLRLDRLPNAIGHTESVPEPNPLLLLNQPEFGQTMRRIREALGWPRNLLADLSGLAASTIHNLEIRTMRSLTERVRHRIVIALVGQCRYAQRCNKAEE